MDATQNLLEKRDKKAQPHLAQYAPLWIIEEVIFLEEEAVQFHVIFQNHDNQWLDRRYRYDGFNDVLYHKGQTVVDEEDVLEIISDKDPYIEVIVADIPNAYGG